MQITESKKVLERALRLSESFHSTKQEVLSWLQSAEEECEETESERGLGDRFADVGRMREKVKGMQR